MDYSTFARIANRILSDWGVAATLTRKSSGTYDPATSVSTVTSATDNVTVAIFPYPAKLIDGTLIHVGDMQVIMGTDGLSAAPEAADNITIGGTVYKIVTVQNIKPANTSVLYELQVRK